jgi:predicted  nucleic acid-binding Zn-ribbon protein
MSKVTKITEEQLSTINRLNQELNSLIHNLGVLESQKHSLLHQLPDVNKEMEDFKKVLEEEYGQININLQTGEYTVIEAEDKTENPEELKSV